MLLLAMEGVRLAVKPSALQILDKINRLLAAEGISAYLVGGFVRDLLTGRDTADIDIAVGADARETARKIAAALGGKYISLDEENGVGRVIIPDSPWYCDFSTLAGDIESDLARRDFTINAIALPLEDCLDGGIVTGKLIDPFDGCGDLRRRILRVTGPGVFAADAVRLLRAVRLATELGLCIERFTETRLRQCSRLITKVAGERVREELLRLLALPGAGQRLAYLDGLGLLTAIIPELEAARGVSQPRLHVWDVFTHSIQTVNAVEFVLGQDAWDYHGRDILDGVPWSETLRDHFDAEIGHGSSRKTLIKLAALLHDIAKPETKTTEADGRTRFLGHPQEGTATAGAIMTRLRFSRREIEHVGLLIKYHLRPTQMTNEETPSRRAIHRFFRDTGETGIDLLFLSLADHLATRGPTLDRQQWREHTRLTADVLAAHFAAAAVPQEPRLLDGHEIMKAFRLSPGPQIGALLEAVCEARAAGEINDKRQALRYIRSRLAADDTTGKK